MRLHWTDRAQEDLRAIENYIARSSAHYAHNMVQRIITRTEILSTSPFLGAKVEEYFDQNIRELLEHPYRIIYKVLAEPSKLTSLP